MAEESVGSSEGRYDQGRTGPDPSSATTDALRREIAHLSDRIDLKIEGVVKAFEARLDALDRATTVFHDDLVRVPTEVQESVGQLRELSNSRFEGVAADILLVREVIQTRFEGMDRALNLLQAFTDRFPERIEEKVGALRELHGGQFSAVQVQFVERDVRTDKMSEASAIAIGAALQAAKEAVAEQNRSSSLAIAKSEAATDKRIDQIGALVATATSALDGKISDIKDRLVRIEGEALGSRGVKSDTSTSNSFTVSLIGIGIAILGALMAAFAFFTKLGGRP